MCVLVPLWQNCTNTSGQERYGPATETSCLFSFFLIYLEIMSAGQIRHGSGIKFVADTMLGRLAKWLRILGYDTLYPGQESDQRLARIATEEGRVLLTRDTELASRKGFRKLLVHSNRLCEQLMQVIEAFDLNVNDRTLSLCLICNRPLRGVEKDEIRNRVPPYVFRTQTQFYQCPQCNKIYWPGTHLDHIRRELEKLGCSV
jgi:uncharacterized protein with PIN domain